MRAAGHVWDNTNATYTAALNGHLDILQYAYEDGAVLDKGSAFQAAWYGHLDCLKYIYENCGRDASWKRSGLRNWSENLAHATPEIRDWLQSVEYSWRNGLHIDNWSNVKAARS